MNSFFTFSEEFLKTHGYTNYQFISEYEMSALLEKMQDILEKVKGEIDEDFESILFTYINKAEEAAYHGDFFNLGFNVGVFVTAASNIEDNVIDNIENLLENISENSEVLQNTKYFSNIKVEYKNMEKIFESLNFIFSYNSEVFSGLESTKELVFIAAKKCNFFMMGVLIGGISLILKNNFPKDFENLKRYIIKAFNMG